MATIQTIDNSVNLLAALLWQHNQAERLTTLLQKKQAWYDENLTEFWDNWVRDVFDLRTANEFGLKVWSIILGLPIVITIAPTPSTSVSWGFGEFNKNFNNGNFGSAGSSATALTPESARILLRLRYYQLIARPNVIQINRFLAYVFKDMGTVYGIASEDMESSQYFYSFQPDPQLLFALEKYDILPRPAAVKLPTSDEPVRTVGFGFGEYNINFNNAPFGA